jgi:hypothetical protein
MGKMDPETFSVSPMQYIRQIQNENCIMALDDVAKSMAVGTRFRGCLVSSTIPPINDALMLCRLCAKLTHMKNTIEAADRKCSSEHPNGKGNTRVAPATIRMQRLPHKFIRATFRQRGKGGDDTDEENDMAYATNGFERADDSSQCEIKQYRNDNQGDEEERCVP